MKIPNDTITNRSRGPSGLERGVSADCATAWTTRYTQTKFVAQKQEHVIVAMFVIVTHKQYTEAGGRAKVWVCRSHDRIVSSYSAAGMDVLSIVRVVCSQVEIRASG